MSGLEEHAPKHEKIYDLCMELAEKETTIRGKTQWIHLSDAVEGGSISPMEAYDAIRYGRLPGNLTVRKSRYAHLL